MKTLYIITLLSCLLLGGCGFDEPICNTSDHKHTWGKWHPDGRRNFDGQTWMVRECSNCGWQQGNYADRKTIN